MKAVVAAFNQEKALVGAFSVITNLRMELFQALIYTRSGSFSSNTRYLTARCCSSYQHPSLLLNGLSFNKELSKDLLKRGETTMNISSTDLICGDWKTSMRMRMEILGREDLQRKKAEETTMNISSTALICGA